MYDTVALWVIGILLAGLLVVLARFGFSVDKAREYFSTPQGQKILSGILTLIGVMSVVGIMIFAAQKVFADDTGTWFKEIEFYAGIERTGGDSIFCFSNGLDDRTTSSAGANLSIYQYHEFNFAATYQHHSCAFNPDKNTYDAYGIKLNYTLDLHDLFR